MVRLPFSHSETYTRRLAVDATSVRFRRAYCSISRTNRSCDRARAVRALPSPVLTVDLPVLVWLAPPCQHRAHLRRSTALNRTDVKPCWLPQALTQGVFWRCTATGRPSPESANHLDTGAHQMHSTGAHQIAGWSWIRDARDERPEGSETGSKEAPAL